MFKKLDNALRPAAGCWRCTVPVTLPPGNYCIFRSTDNMPVTEHPMMSGLIRFDEQVVSTTVIVVGNSKENQYLLVGALTANNSLTHLTVRQHGAIIDSIEVCQEHIPEDGTLPPEELLVLQGDNWQELLAAYGDAAAAANNVKPFDTTENLTGYCSWYYYYANVTESNLMENVAAMEEAVKRGDFPCRIMQIDDGYQTFQGDWNDQDETWPTPLPEIARKIQDAGMVPGIWLMPFEASTASRVFREHPDWFVQNEDGTGPKIADGWSPPPDHEWVCLDATIPEVQEHLANVFRTFHQWGFRYFKLDGLGFALQKGRRRDPMATPVSAYRLGLKAIRSAVPDDFILGCCPCYLPSLGFFDSMRASDDTAARWPNLFYAWKANISHFWMYDRWFRADPDALIARQDRGELNDEEARFSCLTGIISGIAITSDNLRTIAPERVKYLRKAAQYRLKNPVPREWFPACAWPFVFNGTVNGRNAAAIFNWEDNPKTFRLAEIGLKENADEILQELSVNGEITLQPHDGALLVER